MRRGGVGSSNGKYTRSSCESLDLLETVFASSWLGGSMGLEIRSASKSG
jgi:hypothetical protein